jgi:hypothetical protein
MKNNQSSVKRDIVLGIFDLLKIWWVWVAIAVISGFASGTLTSKNITPILSKVVEISKNFVS